MTSARIRAAQTCRRSTGCSRPTSGAARDSMAARRHVFGALGVVWLLACAAPQASGPPDSGQPVAHSGFLGDYAELRPGEGSRARLGYLDPAVDFSGYTHVIIDPVVAWKSTEACFARVPQPQRAMLARA